MKRNQIFSIDTDVLSDLRTRAVTIGVPFSSLAEFFIGGGLKAIPLERLQKWADTKRAERAAAVVIPVEERLTAAERSVLAALTLEWQRPEEIGPKAGKGEGVTWRALNALERAGLAESLIHPNAARHRKTGRPMVSQWRLKPVTP